MNRNFMCKQMLKDLETLRDLWDNRECDIYYTVVQEDERNFRKKYNEILRFWTNDKQYEKLKYKD